MEVHNAREIWKKNIKGLIRKATASVRPSMEDYYRCVIGKPDGELAAVGTFTVGWVNNLEKERIFSNGEWKAMRGLMRATAQGARGVMRVYTRTCCDKTRDKGKLARSYVRALELRQLSIGDFVGQDTAKGNERKLNKCKVRETFPQDIYTPPVDALTEIEREGVGLVSWRA